MLNIDNLPAILDIKQVSEITNLTIDRIKVLENRRDFPKALPRVKKKREKYQWRKCEVIAWINKGNDSLPLSRDELVQLIDERLIAKLRVTAPQHTA